MEGFNHVIKLEMLFYRYFEHFCLDFNKLNKAKELTVLLLLLLFLPVNWKYNFDHLSTKADQLDIIKKSFLLHSRICSLSDFFHIPFLGAKIHALKDFSTQNHTRKDTKQSTPVRVFVFDQQYHDFK